MCVYHVTASFNAQEGEVRTGRVERSEAHDHLIEHRPQRPPDIHTYIHTYIHIKMEIGVVMGSK